MYFTTHGMNYSYFPSPHEHLFSFFFFSLLLVFVPPPLWFSRQGLCQSQVGLELTDLLGIKGVVYHT